jgi:hypothetical protein
MGTTGSAGEIAGIFRQVCIVKDKCLSRCCLDTCRVVKPSAHLTTMTLALAKLQRGQADGGSVLMSCCLPRDPISATVWAESSREPRTGEAGAVCFLQSYGLTDREDSNGTGSCQCITSFCSICPKVSQSTVPCCPTYRRVDTGCPWGRLSPAHKPPFSSSHVLLRTLAF